MKQEEKKPIQADEIAKALRCSASEGGPKSCEGCPYLVREMVNLFGWTVQYESCDTDTIALDAAAILEMLPSGWGPTQPDVEETQ